MFQFRIIPAIALALTMAAFAEGVFDFLPEPPPEASPRAAIDRASELMQQGEVAVAMHQLSRAATAVGETAEVLLHIARCEMQLDRLQEARHTLVRAIDTRLGELGVQRDHATAAAAAVPPGFRHGPLPDNLIGSGRDPRVFGMRTTAADDGGDGADGQTLVVPPDALLSEAWTRLAQIELQRADNISRTGLPENGSVLQAVVHTGRGDDELATQADRCRRSARRFLQQALAIRPDNRTARDLVAYLDD